MSCSTETRCWSGSTSLKYFFTKSSLTTATLTLDAVSWSVKKRPLTMRTPKVLRKSGVTMPKPVLGRMEGSLKAGFPTMVKGMPKPAPKRGRPVMAEAEVTPGTALTLERICL